MARKIGNCLTVIKASSRDRFLTWHYMVDRVTRIELALSASRSHLFGQMCEIHGEDMRIVSRKLGEADVPIEPGSPLIAMPDVQMQSM
jgi:hypothetical protein